MLGMGIIYVQTEEKLAQKVRWEVSCCSAAGFQNNLECL